MTTRARIKHQTLPAAGEAREALREKGQFWTPSWVAEAMVSYAIGRTADTIFDPAVGEGAFLRAAKAVSADRQRPLRLKGTEIDPEALQTAQRNGLSSEDLAGVQVADFLLHSASGPIETLDGKAPVLRHDLLPAIVANPPYIRHHRLSRETKAQLQEYGRGLLGTALDGRAGYHVYFLLRALTRLERHGRLSFIMPADTVEGIFAATLWRWITAHYRLTAVVTFDARATPFPGVDTNALVFMIENSAPQETFSWVRCNQPDNDDLKEWVRSDFQQAGDTITVHTRHLSEGLRTGLSRVPQEEHNGPTLADFAVVIRGIATGDNAFYFLTRAKAKALAIPDEFLLPAIGRTRDLLDNANEVTSGMLDKLDGAGRPTLLFSPDGRMIEHFLPAVRDYLAKGAAAGLPEKSLISTRKPWYKMETRKPPAFLFAYLGRRSARFIRNCAGVVPLTGFLCVYPRAGVSVEALWEVLSHPQTVANLSRVGKSYGDGAIKVEPRSLDRLPLPLDVVEASGLRQRQTFQQAVLLHV